MEITESIACDLTVVSEAKDRNPSLPEAREEFMVTPVPLKQPCVQDLQKVQTHR